jgi:hypothetical protein
LADTYEQWKSGESASGPVRTIKSYWTRIVSKKK